MTLYFFISATAMLLFDSTLTPHPLILTIKVISLSTCLCMTLSIFSLWYAYMLFMVLVGGVLILFTYTSSLSPNAIYHLKPQTSQLAYNLFLTLFSALLITPTPMIINTHNQYQHPTNLIIFFFLVEQEIFNFHGMYLSVINNHRNNHSQSK
uniref:NADH dehydrogenase subunit 6 n=1 Tax=Venustaconcha ellipsiformis TaxID=301928 RepID=D2DW11_VENEL|nr:NADH dehydrogenase subunit 6 [Venustaconcha ellipsiformis]ACQ91042.1 NADH dehydrogenase subunit 6 [Venustaconcha ellipsiformis]